MIHVSIRRVLPGKEQRLREWLAELGARASEVRESWDRETVRSEKAYILPGPEGPLMVYISEAEDSEQARAADASSTLQIDVEHRAVIAACLGEKLDVSALFDLVR